MDVAVVSLGSAVAVLFEKDDLKSEAVAVIVGRLLHVLDEQYRGVAGQHLGRSFQRSRGWIAPSRGADSSAVAAVTIRSIEHQREHRPEHHVVRKLGHQR